MALLLESGLDEFRHLKLRPTVLVATGHVFFDCPTWSENFGDGGLLQVRRIRMRVHPFRLRLCGSHGLRDFFGAFGHWEKANRSRRDITARIRKNREPIK